MRVKGLLEEGRDEETIEKETGVSDRTIRRWKLELERTGRIGKPPESRTGRHRVLSAETEQVGLLTLQWAQSAGTLGLSYGIAGIVRSCQR